MYQISLESSERSIKHFVLSKKLLAQGFHWIALFLARASANTHPVRSLMVNVEMDRVGKS